MTTMKRLMLVILAFALAVVPTGTAFAQDGSGIPPFCDPERVLQRLMFQAENVEDFDDATFFLQNAGQALIECGPFWLQAAIESIAGMLMGQPPMNGTGVNLNPNDGVLTSEEAEFALRAAFAGDFADANQYLCPDEQLDDDDSTIGEIVIDELSCAPQGVDMVCDVTLSVEGDTFEQTVTFEVEDGKLCDSN